MALQSDMFRDDRRLQNCLISDAEHLTEGTVGPFVQKVQVALFVTDGLRVDVNESRQQRYGPSTAAAVLSFKRQRGIINRSYQQSADNIVGKMTISALDQELLRKEQQAHVARSGPSTARGGTAAAFRPDLVVRTSFAPVTAPPPAGSPAQVAKSRAPQALTGVQMTRQRLAAMTQFHRQPSIPTNPLVMASFDRLWECFGMPKFPKNSPLIANASNGAVRSISDYLQVVDEVFTRVAGHLANAATVFSELQTIPKGEDATLAFTVTTPRKGGDPQELIGRPDGIYFAPPYLFLQGERVGPRKQIEVAMHECGHFVQNDNITDVATESLSSAHGYSDFFLFCAFNRKSFSAAE